MVYHVEHKVPLCIGDQQTLKFNLNSYAACTIPPEKLNHNRGDYAVARRKFQEIPITAEGTSCVGYH